MWARSAGNQRLGLPIYESKADFLKHFALLGGFPRSDITFFLSYVLPLFVRLMLYVCTSSRPPFYWAGFSGGPPPGGGLFNLSYVHLRLASA